MSFNIMCNICGNPRDHGFFKQRLVSIADTLNRHNPDLVGLQEFIHIKDVRGLMKKLNTRYHILYSNHGVIKSKDTILLVRKDRFQVKSSMGVWLGPRPEIPIGWDVFSIPRRLHWAQLYDNLADHQFIFMGSHFDNNNSNKTPSAIFVNDLVKAQSLPVVFVGDTNLKTSSTGYSLLLGNELVDSFPGLERVAYHANWPFEVHDGCNTSKSPRFPDCRIDHVLLSKNSPLITRDWALDLYRYHGKLGFVSDHRAVIVTLEFSSMPE